MTLYIFGEEVRDATVGDLRHALKGVPDGCRLDMTVQLPFDVHEALETGNVVCPGYMEIKAADGVCRLDAECWGYNDNE